MGARVTIWADARMADSERAAMRRAFGAGAEYSIATRGMLVCASDGVGRPVQVQMPSGPAARDVAQRFRWWAEPERMRGEPAWRILRRAVEEHRSALAAQRRRRFRRALG
jgi:hypothetical protein